MAEDRSLTETPTWAVATIISLMVIVVFSFTKSVEFFGRVIFQILSKKKKLLCVFLIFPNFILSVYETYDP